MRESSAEMRNDHTPGTEHFTDMLQNENARRLGGCLFFSKTLENTRKYSKTLENTRKHSKTLENTRFFCLPATAQNNNFSSVRQYRSRIGVYFSRKHSKTLGNTRKHSETLGNTRKHSKTLGYFPYPLQPKIIILVV